MLKLNRGPDKGPQRGGFGLLAVLCQPLFYN